MWENRKQNWQYGDYSCSLSATGILFPPRNFGDHQFHLPINRIALGTTNALTKVASMNIARASPICFVQQRSKVQMQKIRPP